MIRCPFPGMDPYIERSEIWPDFHDRLITYLCAALKPLLLPRYVALTQDRQYVVEAERPIWPDVSIVELHNEVGAQKTAVAVAEVEVAVAEGSDAEEADDELAEIEPMIFELSREQIRQPYIEIVETASSNRVVTAIEVLSPSNKLPGRSSYLQKREEYWNAGTNLVEIDLLREGEPTIRVGQERLEMLRPWHYLIAVTRTWPSRQEVYPVRLQRKLPRFKVPLAENDLDVRLDLQAAFARCWEDGPYPALLRYSSSPPGTMSLADMT
jgi:hypothetical protein